MDQIDHTSAYIYAWKMPVILEHSIVGNKKYNVGSLSLITAVYTMLWQVFWLYLFHTECTDDKCLNLD